MGTAGGLMCCGTQGRFVWLLAQWALENSQKIQQGNKKADVALGRPSGQRAWTDPVDADLGYDQARETAQ